jgi:hypothetical protein
MNDVPLVFNKHGGLDAHAPREVWNAVGFMPVTQAARDLDVPFDLALAWAKRYGAYVHDHPYPSRNRHYVHKTWVQSLRLLFAEVG